MESSLKAAFALKTGWRRSWKHNVCENSKLLGKVRFLCQERKRHTLRLLLSPYTCKNDSFVYFVLKRKYISVIGSKSGERGMNREEDDSIAQIGANSFLMPDNIRGCSK